MWSCKSSASTVSMGIVATSETVGATIGKVGAGTAGYSGGGDDTVMPGVSFVSVGFVSFSDVFFSRPLPSRPLLMRLYFVPQNVPYRKLFGCLVFSMKYEQCLILLPSQLIATPSSSATATPSYVSLLGYFPKTFGRTKYHRCFWLPGLVSVHTAYPVVASFTS